MRDGKAEQMRGQNMLELAFTFRRVSSCAKTYRSCLGTLSGIMARQTRGEQGHGLKREGQGWEDVSLNAHEKAANWHGFG